MPDKKDTVSMICNKCGNRGDFSPLRLGRVCGKCKEGKYKPLKT